METLYITFGTWILAIIIAMIAAANSRQTPKEK